MLSGYRVVELTDERGVLAGRILADMGAEVIKVEPPGGDPWRQRGPFLGGNEDGQAGLPWLVANAGKRSVVADLEEESGRENVKRLLEAADVLLESHGPATMSGWGLGWEGLRTSFPRLVYCSITPFGREGPYAGYRAHDLTVVAMGGNLAMTGDPDRAPVRCTMPTSYYHAAPEAALGVTMALAARERSGQGALVDLSMQECQVSTLMTGAGQYGRGRKGPRRAGARIGRTREIWRAKDGWISFGLRGGQARVPNLVRTAELMAEAGLCPQWLAGYDWESFNHNTLSDEEIARFEDAFAAFFATRTMGELYGSALEHRILLAPCNDAREVLGHPQLRSRELFERIEYPELGTSVEQPAFFARVASRGIRVRGPAPRVGEMEIMGSDAIKTGSGKITDKMGPDPIYQGLKILEFGSGAAGPLATRYFAEQGAQVVRIESTKRPDFLRTLHLTDADRFGLDGSPMFILMNPDKQSLTLDLSKPEALELVGRLVVWADVVTENFAPGVMARWGLDAASLRELKPELIVASCSLFGQTGPQRSYPGFGGQGSAIAGFNHMTGYPETEAHGPYGTITDSLAPRFLALTIAAALLRRSRTGEGETIDLSQIETGVYCLSEMVARHSATGEVPARRGDHDENACPHSVYPCRGEDRWIAIACRSDEQWQALARLTGASGWADDKTLATLAGRLASEDEIDRKLSSWTRENDTYELMHALQEVGVEAGVVQDFEDLARDPQLAARRHFETLDHKHLGTMHFERPAFWISGHPGRLERPGPDLGEHNTEMLAGVLGLARDEIERLEREAVVA